MSTNRRQFLRNSAAAGTGIFFAGNLTGLFAGAPAISSCVPRRGLGPLIDDPNGLLDLPEEFSYKIISQVGDPMSNGVALADRFDGTASFGRGRTIALVRNHEQDTGAAFPTVAAPELTYDPVCGGGTSTVAIRDGVGKVEEYISLAGTNNNCAGGATPWGTWLTCEETEDRAGDADGHTKDHGFVFEVHPSDRALNVNPTPLTALGRFAHEAAIVDPRTGIVYLTEDASRPNGLVYRCLPTQTRGRYGSLRAGGVLEAMRCTDNGTFVPDLSAYSQVGTTLNVGWVAVPDPVAMTTPTRSQLPEVTRSRKFEGAWWGNRVGYIVASYARTSDGSVGQHDGQVWRFDPRGGTLTLDVHFGLNPDYASDNPDGPDNITVSPWGGLILCEDGEGTQLLRSVTPEGETVAFARNARDDGEFAGACFGQDRNVLYVSLQQPGVTFAITGPFIRLQRGD